MSQQAIRIQSTNEKPCERQIIQSGYRPFFQLYDNKSYVYNFVKQQIQASRQQQQVISSKVKINRSNHYKCSIFSNYPQPNDFKIKVKPQKLQSVHILGKTKTISNTMIFERRKSQEKRSCESFQEIFEKRELNTETQSNFITNFEDRIKKQRFLLKQKLDQKIQILSDQQRVSLIKDHLRQKHQSTRKRSQLQLQLQLSNKIKKKTPKMHNLEVEEKTMQTTKLTQEDNLEQPQTVEAKNIEDTFTKKINDTNSSVLAMGNQNEVLENIISPFQYEKLSTTENQTVSDIGITKNFNPLLRNYINSQLPLKNFANIKEKENLQKPLKVVKDHVYLINSEKRRIGFSREVFRPKNVVKEFNLGESSKRMNIRDFTPWDVENNDLDVQENKRYDNLR